MRGRLSKRCIDAIRPHEGRLWVHDTALPGFALNVTAAGVKAFYVRLRLAPGRSGRRAWLKLGDYGPITADEARSRARQALARAARGEDPTRERTTALEAETFDALFPEYIADVLARRKPTTAREYTRIGKRYILPALSRKLARDVTTADIAKLHASLSGRPYMGNRCIAVAGAFFTWAARLGHVPEGYNPARGVEMYGERAKERFLSAAELGQLGAALARAEREGLPPAPARRWRRGVPASGSKAKHRPKSAGRLYPSDPIAVGALRFIVLSGWRKGEVVALKWSELDAERGHAILADSKTGRSVRPLGTAVWDLLGALPRYEGSPWVFPSARAPKTRHLSGVEGLWARVRHAAALDGVRLHDVRHTAASLGVAGGLSLPLLAAVLGHKNAATTSKYAHLSDDPRRVAADRMSGGIAGALASGSRDTVPAIRGVVPIRA